MKRLEEKLDRYNYYSDSVTLHLKQTGLTHVILNEAKRSEESSQVDWQDPVLGIFRSLWSLKMTCLRKS